MATKDPDAQKQKIPPNPRINGKVKEKKQDLHSKDAKLPAPESPVEIHKQSTKVESGDQEQQIDSVSPAKEADGLLGQKRTFEQSIDDPPPPPVFDDPNDFDAPMNVMMMMSLNQTHNTQRKRDIKQNYKAKLPLDKLIQEHEKKKSQLQSMIDKRSAIREQIKTLWDRIGQRQGVNIDLDDPPKELEGGDGTVSIETKPPVRLFDEQSYEKTQGKTHWDFLLKEMMWMADDFEKESKKKQGDAKKYARNSKKHLNEKLALQDKQIREQKIELKRKSKQMSNMVQMYWKSCEKIVKHNYNVQYERKRQQMRTKKLENFVQKHLKLSVKVAETLNTKSFVKQSLYNKGDQDPDKSMVSKEGDTSLIVDDGTKQIKMYDPDQDEKKQEQVSPQKSAEQQRSAQKSAEADESVELAQNFQPIGNTLDSAKVTTEIPFLLTGSLREYQIIGMDWLVTLHNRKLNGILADEMGLGKTIQTISMLASLACDKGIWGPHLIVVPTTIIMNWEMEFKKWCPGFKILTYFGSQKERKIKRHGWSKENSFHICITSYKLVIQDHFAFRRKKWYYMILDEAQNIKNFKSQRWQTLLRFNTKRRLLLTGTPLQNDVMELWSLMHFLMPHIFSNMQDFKEWFSNPFSQSVNQNKSLNLRVVQKLQSILRPFLLRRMKKDVEKQLPEKIEHIVQCNLSRRQRLLYDEYINTDKTRNILADSDFFSIMSILMQLRKVCNHPDLFEARSIESPFILGDQDKITYSYPTFMIKDINAQNYERDVNLKNLNLNILEREKQSASVAKRRMDLIPHTRLNDTILHYKNLQSGSESIYQHQNTLSDNLMSNRPFQDGLSVSYKHFTNCHVLQKPNCATLHKTIPNIMPFDQDLNYKMQYHDVPSYLNSACIPFSQQYFSVTHYDKMRFSSFDQGLYNPVTQYKSAIQEEEQKLQLVKLAKKLALWHSIDRKNRLQILHGQPVMGLDLRESISVTLVCQDVFDNKRHKYLNHKRYRQIYESNKVKCQADSKFDQQSSFEFMYNFPSSVLNPLCKDQKGAGKSVVVTDWPHLTDSEIDEVNSTNIFIKEITLKTREAIRLKKEQREREERLKQPKRVIRTKEIQTTYELQEFNIVIDLGGIKKQEAQNQKQVLDIAGVEKPAENQTVEKVEIPPQGSQNDANKEEKDDVMNQDANESKPAENNTEQKVMDKPDNEFVQFFEQKVTKVKTQTKSYEEIITYGQYLQEQKDKGIISSELKLLEAAQKPQEILNTSMEAKNPNQSSKKSAQSQQSPITLSVSYKNTDTLRDLIMSPLQRATQMEEVVKNFKVIVPKCVAKSIEFIPSKVLTPHQKDTAYERFLHQKLMQHKNVSQSLKYSNILFFPHKNLIQYDCGKLQKLAKLLKTLYNKGSKCVIFTQMTKMLDIFEQFLNLHGYIYVRLDGSVKTENRQKLVDRFNLNKRIFCFISSTRCGGVGINLTGADCVIFYDTDWNPAMDKQAQDRCHRIGQTKTVHIYRLISVNTIEENIFKKSLQKRELGGLIIEGNFNQEFFQKVSVKDILSNEQSKFMPKRFDIMKEENIVFEEDQDEIIVQHERQGDDENEVGEDQNDEVNFETNSQDLEIQAKQLEQQRQVEQYRRKFEEALIQIEDQEDVEAMQGAKKEMKLLRDEDGHEFDEIQGIDADTIALDLNTEGLTDEQIEALKQQKKQELLEIQRQKELAAKQKINDGISLTQGEMKKHLEIDWNANPNLNKVTKMCLNTVNQQITFEEYLEERAKKDSKFVNLDDEDDKIQEQEKQIQEQNISEGSVQDEYYQEEDTTTIGEISKQGSAKKRWNRQLAQQFYKETRVNIDERLNQDLLAQPLQQQNLLTSQPLDEGNEDAQMEDEDDFQKIVEKQDV